MAARSISEPIVQVRVRLATLDDAAACADIYRPAVETGTGTFETDPPDAAEMRERMARCLTRGWPWIVAEGAGGAVVGYAYCGQFRDRAAYVHAGETSVYVAEGHQGQGVGRALLDALLHAGRAAGFCQFIAVIGDSANSASLALHAALGFWHVGTLTAVGLKFGRWLDVVFMQRD